MTIPALSYHATVGPLLRVFAAENMAGATLAKYRRSLIEERYAGVVLDHTRQGKFWFVLSGTRGDNVLYERVTFACDGKLIHRWQMHLPIERAHPVRPCGR